MAKRIRVELIDDLDGSVLEDNAGESVKFGLDGVSYSLDLSKSNAKDFRSVMKKYIDNAEQSTGTRQTRRSGGSGRTSQELAKVREWLISQGHEVSPRGRVKAELLALYDDAH